MQLKEISHEMASRGPLVGAARLFSSDRLDDMERRFQDRGTSKGRPVRDTAGYAISMRTTYLKSHISGPVFASFLEGNHGSLKSKKSEQKKIPSSASTQQEARVFHHPGSFLGDG